MRAPAVVHSFFLRSVTISVYYGTGVASTQITFHVFPVLEVARVRVDAVDCGDGALFLGDIWQFFMGLLEDDDFRQCYGIFARCQQLYLFAPSTRVSNTNTALSADEPVAHRAQRRLHTTSERALCRDRVDWSSLHV